MESIRLYYRIDRRQINMARFIFEAYEGVATVTTLDAVSGRIVLAVAPGCECIAREVMDDIGKRVAFEKCDAPDGA